MSSHEQPSITEEFLPFKEALVMFPYSKRREDKKIAQFASNPDVIIRIDKNYGLRAGNNGTYEEKREIYLATRAVFDQLSSSYGMHIARHDFVIAGRPSKPVFYTVSELIHGTDLKYTEFSPRERAIATEKLDHLYTGLANYALDLYLNGGWLIDLFGYEARNRQFVWGKIKGDKEKNVWLVDVEGNAGFVRPRSECIYAPPNILTSLRGLIQMIKESENNLGGSILSRSRDGVGKIILEHQRYLEDHPDTGMPYGLVSDFNEFSRR